MAAQIGFEGRVVTINVDGYARSANIITDAILYSTIDNLFQKYDAVFLEYTSTEQSSAGLVHDLVMLKTYDRVDGYVYYTVRDFGVKYPNSEGNV